MRLISPEGKQIGILPLEEALKTADEIGLDLVEVDPVANPPVCRIMDYGKYKYEQTIKLKEARKKQTLITFKEMKMRPKIDQHDYEIKMKHVRRFLEAGNKVKVTIMFRGREMSHVDLGERLLQKLAEDVSDLGSVESPAKLDGRNMLMILTPQVLHRRGDHLSKKEKPKNKRADMGSGEGEEKAKGSETATQEGTKEAKS